MKLALSCFLFLFLQHPPPFALAAEPSPETSPPVVLEELPRLPTAKGALVVLDGKALFHLQGISSYPAEFRAKIVAGKIKEAAADPSFAADKVTLVEKGDRTAVVFGTNPLVTVVDRDASAEGVSRKILAEVIRGRIIAGINDYRAARQPRVLIRNAGYAIFAALVLAAAVFGLMRGFRWLRRRSVAHIERKLRELEIQSRHILQAEQLAGIVNRLLAGLQWLAIFTRCCLRFVATPVSPALVFLLLAGCATYEPAPSPSKFDLAWSAAVGAAQDEGVRIISEDRGVGTITGSRGEQAVTINVRTQADGGVRVEISARGPKGSDPGLAGRISRAYDRRMRR